MLDAAAALHVVLWLCGSAAFVTALGVLLMRADAFLNADDAATVARKRAAAGGAGAGAARGGARAPGGAVRRRPGDTQA
jgi:hypothetical protein